MTNEAREQEVWKVYPDYSFVEVSNLGRVRTKDRYVRNRGGKRLIKGQILKQRLYKNGYMYVQIRENGKQVYLKVHRMVAITFIPNPNNYPQVNHIDNDKTNNSVNNLEWCTNQYNQDYKKKFGTSPAQVLGRSVIATNPETGEVLWFESQSEAARQLGAYAQHINRVVRGRRHKTRGYWFTYADENAVEKTRSKFGNEIAEKVEKLMNERKTV